MWDAYATQNGFEVCDWETNSIPDPHLAAAFEAANRQLQALGFDSRDFLRVGWIAYSANRTMLAHGTKRSVMNDSEDGVLIWTEEEVQAINQEADWNFPIADALEDYEHVDETETAAFHTSRIFWETCVKEHLGIRFSF